jgi:hypothetical protein
VQEQKPRIVKVEHTVKVTETDYPHKTIAETKLSETVVLSASEPVFDPALSLIEQMGRDASNKTTAQVTAFEHLEKAQAEASPAPAA